MAGYDKVLFCPTCHHEIENHECEQCEENEQQKASHDEQAINNYIDKVTGDL